MRNSWRNYRLGDVVERLTNGYVGPTRNIYQSDGVPYLLAKHVKNNNLKFDDVTYVSKEFNEKNKKSKLINGDVLLVQSGHIGHSAVVPRKHEGHNCHAMIVITPKELITGNYLSLFFNSPQMVTKFQEIRSGSTVPHLTCKAVKELQIPIPSLSEQKQIVEILDQAFEAIDQAKANIEKNIANAKELLESYKTELLEKYASGNLVGFKSIVTLSRGQNPPKTDFIYEPKDGYVRFYQIRDGWSDEYMVFVPDTPKLHLVKEDEMLMVAYRHIGKVFRGVNGAFNVALCKITNKNTDVLNNDYLFELIPSPFIKGELLKISERSLIPSMSVKELEKLKVPLPSIEDQSVIVELLNSINKDTGDIITKYETKLNSIEELKKSILQKAFAGELTSKEVLLSKKAIAV